MRFEKLRNFAECFLGLRQKRSQKLSVALAFDELQRGHCFGLPQLPMGSHRIIKQQIARSRRQEIAGGNSLKSPLIGDSRGSCKSYPAA